MLEALIAPDTLGGMKTAVLGTGIMGAAMARSLAREGHDVTVWNRSADKAEATAGERIVAAGSVTEAVTGADVVVTMLFDTDAVIAVTDELVAALGTESVWVQASTVGPDGVRAIEDRAGAASVRLLDAPVLGTRKPAEDGALVVLVSGTAAARQAAQPVFDAVGSRTVTVSDELGSASALKLVCNSWIATINAATAQAHAMASAVGLSPAQFLEAIEGGPLDVGYAHVKSALMDSRDWDTPAFAVDGVRKDLGLIIGAAASGGMPTGLLETLLSLYEDTSEKGLGGADMSAVRAAFDG